MTRIAVTQLEFDKAADVFRAAKDLECIRVPNNEEGLAAAIREHDAGHAIVGVDRYVGPLYEALPRGGVIARFGVGYDGIDIAQAEQRGILCCNTPGVLDQSVAECAVALMLDAARHVARSHCDLRNGTWQNRVGTELSGKTLVVIGCGAIGRRVAKIAKHGFDMLVVGHDIRPVDDPTFDETTADFAHAVAEADVVSLHIPDISATRDFINAERLALLRSDAILVNTARGGVLDEDALFDAVESENLAAAALDVFKTEPYAPQTLGKDLRTSRNILMTSHIGSSTREACRRMSQAALDNIRHAENGQSEKMCLIAACRA